MNRECGKNRYKTEEEALKVLKTACRHTERKKLPVRVYLCPNCGGWHMTSKKNKKKKGKTVKNKAFEQYLSNE